LTRDQRFHNSDNSQLYFSKKSRSKKYSKIFPWKKNCIWFSYIKTNPHLLSDKKYIKFKFLKNQWIKLHSLFAFCVREKNFQLVQERWKEFYYMFLDSDVKNWNYWVLENFKFSPFIQNYLKRSILCGYWRPSQKFFLW